MRRGQAIGEQQVGQHQIVDVAAVAGHIDDLMAVRGFLHTGNVVDLDALVELVPEPGEDDFEEADYRVGIVRGDLVGVLERQGFGFGLIQLGFAGQFLGNCRLHARRMHQSLDQGAAVREVGADHRRLLVAEVHPQNALDHAQGALAVLLLVDQLAQLDGFGELHTGLAAQHQNAEQLAQTPGHAPAVGEQQLPRARFAVRRQAPEHADRNDLRLGFAVQLKRLHQTLQGRGDAALVLTAEPAGGRSQVEEGHGLFAAADRHRQYRAWQTGLAAFGIDHRQVAGRRLLQHVEDRSGRVDLQREGRLVDGFGTHKGRHQAAQGTEGKATKRGAGHTNSDLDSRSSGALSVPDSPLARKTQLTV